MSIGQKTSAGATENREGRASASAEGARVRRRQKASASLSPEALRFREAQFSDAKLLQSPHKLEKLQLLGL